LAIGEDGRFEGNLEKFRQKHQRISRLVDEIDKFLSLYVGTAVVCSTATFVLVLYSLIFIRNNTSPAIVILSFWMIATALHLTIAAFGAVKVNQVG